MKQHRAHGGCGNGAGRGCRVGGGGVLEADRTHTLLHKQLPGCSEGPCKKYPPSRKHSRGCRYEHHTTPRTKVVALEPGHTTVGGRAGRIPNTHTLIHKTNACKCMCTHVHRAAVAGVGLHSNLGKGCGARGARCYRQAQACSGHCGDGKTTRACGVQKPGAM